jgi:hypothetical protein
MTSWWWKNVISQTVGLLRQESEFVFPRRAGTDKRSPLRLGSVRLQKVFHLKESYLYLTMQNRDLTQNFQVRKRCRMHSYYSCWSMRNTETPIIHIVRNFLGVRIKTALRPYRLLIPDKRKTYNPSYRPSRPWLCRAQENQGGHSRKRIARAKRDSG